MTAFLDDLEPATDEQRVIVDRLRSVLERLAPALLDEEASSASVDGNGLHVALRHRDDPDQRIDIVAGGSGEVVVSYGPEHEHFRADDAAHGRVWPFLSPDHIAGSLHLVEYLLTGRVELEAWRRPLWLKTRSYWIDDDGERQLFLRGGTVGPVWGWSSEPSLTRFDFRG